MALRKGGIGEIADLHCCGPGAQAITRWAQSIGRQNRLVILAGLAGAIDPATTVGEAFVVWRVVDEHGVVMAENPDTSAISGRGFHCVITSSSSSVTTPDEKAQLFCQSGANLVDLESIALVKAAQDSSWPWMIVRGVSDGADDQLPSAIDQWVDERGRVRGRVVIRSILGNFGLIPTILRLRRNGVTAMEAVAMHIRKLANG